MFTFIDLFAGCGGLSLGLQRAGGKHVLAIEKSPMASETYFQNLLADSVGDWEAHRGKTLEGQVSSGLVVGEVGTVLANTNAMNRISEMEIDLVAGGPPCQGFSLAGKRRRNDHRNRLAWEFLDFVGKVGPKFVLIENVVGIHRKFRNGGARTPFESLQLALAGVGSGYLVQGLQLNAAHYGAPQSRPRLMILGVRQDVVEDLGITNTGDLWMSDYLRESTAPNSLLPIPTVTHSARRTVRMAISDLDPALPPNLMAQDRTYVREMKDSKTWFLTEKPTSNIELRKHRESTRQLFRLLQVLSRIGALPLARHYRGSDFSADELIGLEAQLRKAEYPLKSPDDLLEIVDIAGAVRLIEEHLTLKHSQNALKWDEPSQTVVTIPDDYLHPHFPRTFSVRELARLQGFPDSFKFHGKVTTGGLSRRVDVPQYSQVGNAVSPYVALAIGALVAGHCQRLTIQKTASRGD